MPITYITGDATHPVGNGQKVIVHVCNDVGAWGAGFVMAISRRWPDAERSYRELRILKLGDVDFVRVTPDIVVANLIGQRGVWFDGSTPPIRYDAVRAGLRKLGHNATRLMQSIHMPRIGCGLAGGTWDKIEPIIQQELAGLQVTVYDLPPKNNNL